MLLSVLSLFYCEVLQRLLLVQPDRFSIAILLTKDTTAVFLHIKTQLSGTLLSGPKSRTEITIKKFYAPFMSGLIGNLRHAVMLLIGTDKQGGGKGIKSVFGGKPCRLLRIS